MAGIEQQPIVLLNPARAQGQLEKLSRHNTILADQAAQLEENKKALQHKVTELEDRCRDDAERHQRELEGFEDKIDALEKRINALEATLNKQ